MIDVACMIDMPVPWNESWDVVELRLWSILSTVMMWHVHDAFYLGTQLLLFQIANIFHLPYSLLFAEVFKRIHTRFFKNTPLCKGGRCSQMSVYSWRTTLSIVRTSMHFDAPRCVITPPTCKNKQVSSAKRGWGKTRPNLTIPHKIQTNTLIACFSNHYSNHSIVETQ